MESIKNGQTNPKTQSVVTGTTLSVCASDASVIVRSNQVIRPSVQMAALCDHIAKKARVNLGKPLRIELQLNQRRLIIESEAQHSIAVSECEKRTLIERLVFWRAESGMLYPAQSYCSPDYVYLSLSGRPKCVLLQSKQEMLARYADAWAERLTKEGWPYASIIVEAVQM